MSRNIKILTWFNFFTDFKLYAPIAIIYFAQVSGSFALGMSIFSITMISSALLEVPTGVFSDRIGRKKTVVLGAIAATLAAVFYAIGQAFWILVIGALFEGLSRSFYSGNNDALLHGTLAENNQTEKYADYLGKTSKMFQLALAISAVLGGLILIKWNIPVILWLSVIPQIFCVILSSMLIEPQVVFHKSANIYQHLKEALFGFTKNKKLRLLSLSSIVGYGLGEATYLFHSAFFATVWPVWAIPFSKVLSNLGATISFHYSGAVIKRFNIFKILIGGNIYFRIMMTIATVFPTIASPIIVSSGGLLYGIVQVAKNSLMQKEFKQEQRATMSSLNSFAGSIFFGIIAFLIGFLADKFSPAQAILIFQVFQLSLLYIYWRLFKYHN
ncbi:MAG: hypothetical protein A2798_01035 [Candidatus Levybacteria bacterium RIFCSPHIGHO2_01_FULL_37_17]|nr:MAG: hypothetical protein A2798_01035 [Candidatus Levybacteria bacterium RIFCSPHIGHO2_01_FULL_37_17]OGH37036.1 MAG: hypothetical protein A2959_01895 [Candidatus Levybacteria bacterium RIFCSPLOWO2_01_FULL_38_23]